MGWSIPDVYYQPEKFGLTPVAEIEYSSGMYEFDTRVVWRHSSGLLFTARDSGCSCPSPFEDFTSLEQVDLFDYGEIEAEVAREVSEPWTDIPVLIIANFLNKIWNASRDAVKPSEVQTHIRRMIQEAVTSG